MKEKTLKLGSVVATRAVDEAMSESYRFMAFVRQSLDRHMRFDWGDVCEEDRKSNDYAADNEERILSVYIFKPTGRKIWIITEWDRSYTTILFPEDY